MINFLYSLFRDRTFGAVRSPKWSSVRKQHLEKNPICAVCNSKGTFFSPLEVHHIEPFYLKPKLELKPDNLITLCRPHHLLFGHLMSWKSFNSLVVADSKIWNRKVITRI